MLIPCLKDQLRWYNEKAISFGATRNKKLPEVLLSSSVSLLDVFNTSVNKKNVDNSCVDMCNEFLLKDAGRCVKYQNLLDSSKLQVLKEESDVESVGIVEKTFILTGY